MTIIDLINNILNVIFGTTSDIFLLSWTEYNNTLTTLFTDISAYNGFTILIRLFDLKMIFSFMFYLCNFTLVCSIFLSFALLIFSFIPKNLRSLRNWKKGK